MLRRFSTGLIAGKFGGQLIVSIRFGRLLLLFFFLHHSWVALAACAGAQSGRGIQSLSLPVTQKELGSPETPKQYHFWGLGSWNRYLRHSSEKRKSSHSSAVRFLYCLANSKPAAICVAVSRSFFCLQPSLFMNLQTVFFPRTGPLLAHFCESCLVKFSFVSFLQNFFLGDSFRIFCFPVFFCLQNLHSLMTILLPNVRIFPAFCFSSFLNYWARTSKYTRLGCQAAELFSFNRVHLAW